MSPGTSLGQLSVFKNKYTNKVVISKVVDNPFLGQGAQMRCNCSCLYFLQSQKCFWRFHGFKLVFFPPTLCTSCVKWYHCVLGGPGPVGIAQPSKQSWGDPQGTLP